MADTTSLRVADVLRNTVPLAPPPSEDAVVMHVIAVAAELFHITSAEILGPSREREPVQARQVAMAVARARTTLSLPHLGDLFDRDHSTVHASIRRVIETPVLCQWAAAVDESLTKESHACSPITGYNGGGPGDCANSPRPVADPSSAKEPDVSNVPLSPLSAP